MESQNTQPKRRHRRLAVSVVLFFAMVMLLSVTWRSRIAFVTRVVRSEFDRHGLADATCRLVRLSPGCVVLEDFRLGAPEAVLTIGRAEVRFTCPDVARGRLDSIRVSGLRTCVTIDGGQVLASASG